MGRKMARKALAMALAGLALPLAAQAADEELLKKIDKLTQELEVLKGSVKKVEDKSIGKWLSIGGEYRFRADSLYGQTKAYMSAPAFMNTLMTDPNTSGFFATAGARALLSSTSYSAVAGLNPGVMMGNLVGYLTAPGNAFAGNPAGAAAYLNGLGAQAAVGAYKPKNETLYTNKLALELTARPIQDITVHTKLSMYKAFGSQTDDQVTGNYFADRVGVFDGTLSHLPSSSLLNVDRAYVTWSNIADQPIWFSVGRRPSTDGAPTNLKLNNERPGNGGNPAMLINYAFDGGSLGWAPDLEALPGAYAKVCAGRGFDSGIKTTSTHLNDTDFAGVAVLPVDTDPLRVWFQWMRAWDIFDFPVMQNSSFGNTAPSVSLGNIDWYGAGAMTTIKKVGPGTLNFFADFGMSVTHPNNNVSANAGFQGLLTGGFLNPQAPVDRTGYGVYTGIRYDLPSRTKFGFEYNHGSKYWITFAPAADDMWTSKVGTRGHVFEPYVIQELDLKPISKYLAKAFFKVGYQYYDFEYTGSNNWVGAPVKIADIKPTDLLLMTPMSHAQNIYGTFEVHF